MGSLEDVAFWLGIPQHFRLNSNGLVALLGLKNKIISEGYQRISKGGGPLKGVFSKGMV